MQDNRIPKLANVDREKKKRTSKEMMAEHGY